MLLFLLRHGQADPGPPGGRDADRRLTPDGEESLRRVLQRASAAGLKPEAMLASPYIRARETVEIAKQVLGFSGQVSLSNALVPDSLTETVWDEIRLQSESLTAAGSQLLLVGHNPLLSDLLVVLLGAGEHGMDLKTAALACVDLGAVGLQPKGRLLWLLTPDVRA